MDIPLVNIYGTNDGDKEKQKQYVLQTGILSSALEHAVPEQMFVNEQNPGEAISAVKALQKASQQGQRIYHITKDNQWTILGNIHHDQATMDEIRNALNAGKEVITHTSAVSVPGWSGAGYIITDPTTGAGAYKIAGGGNGGYLNLDEETLALISGLSLGLAAAAIAGLFSLVTITPLIGIILFLSVVDVVLVALYNLEIWSDGTDRCFGVGFAIGAAYARLAFATSLIQFLERAFLAVVGATASQRYVSTQNCL